MSVKVLKIQQVRRAQAQIKAAHQTTNHMIIKLRKKSNQTFDWIFIVQEKKLTQNILFQGLSESDSPIIEWTLMDV
jgi:hypothetical protein